MRKYYVDNIKLVCILLLFPYHTAMIWNNFGDGFYIFGTPNNGLSAALLFMFPILMPLLFTLAGVSTHFSLEKRTVNEYLQERLLRLLVPVITGVVLLVPVQSFFAEKFHKTFSYGYFYYLPLYFTKSADANGYTGGFGLANLWFLLYLFIISLVAVIVISFCRFLKGKIGRGFDFGSLPFPIILLLFVLPWLLTPAFEVMGGKSFGKFFILFLLGYYVLSKEKAVLKCVKYRYFTLLGFVILEAAAGILYFNCGLRSGTLFNGLVSLTGWVGILSFVGLFKSGFDFTNKTLTYLCRISFPIYIFHQTVLVAVGYYVLTYLSGIGMPQQFLIIMVLSFIITLGVVELIRRIPFVRTLFGIKHSPSVV